MTDDACRQTEPELGPLDLRHLARVASLGPTRRWIELRKFSVPIVKVYSRNYYDPDDLDRFVASLPRQVPAHDLVSTMSNDRSRKKRARR